MQAGGEMTYEQLIRQLDPRIYRRLRESLELGKWPDGRALTEEQKALCMEAIIWYEREHEIPEQERAGYISRAGCSASGDPVRVRDN